MREMEAGQSPEWRDFDDRYPIYKSNYDQRKSLGVRSGVFERHWKSDDGIARSKVKEIRADMHGGKTGGHLGVNKTIDKVRQRCWTSRGVNSVAPVPPVEVSEAEVGA